MANEYTLGQKISGIGAALGGTVPQFQQEMQQLDEARMKAMYQDAGAAYQMYGQNNIAGIIELANDRLRILQRLPGSDPSDTMQALKLAQAAQAGDQSAYSQLGDFLKQANDSGIARGYFAAPAGPKYLGAEQGMLLFQNPDGTVETRPISTDESYVDPEEKSEALKGIRSTMTNWNKSASEVASAYNKVKGLESEMRNKSRAAINAGIMNVARLISPGVVTDRDAAALSGADTSIAAIFGFLSGKGLDTNQLMRIVDPTNPDTFNVDQLMAVAERVTASQIPSLLNTASDAKNIATNYKASNQFMNSYFGDTETMKSLQEIMGTVSGNMQNAEGVPLSFNSEQEADFYANTTGIPDGTEIKISGITGTWTNE
jgi:hypothetical protein